MVKFNNDEYKHWTAFLSKPNEFNEKEYNLVCKLHAKYFKHQLFKPCPSCSRSIINRYIKELNTIYKNGDK